MKKKIIIIVSALLFLMIIGYCAFTHFNPHFKLIGTWTGDRTLDLLGDSPFDGAIELTFFMNHTGLVITEQGETPFTYDVHKREHAEYDIIILDGGNGYNHGQQFIIEERTLTILGDDANVIFTRR